MCLRMRERWKGLPWRKRLWIGCIGLLFVYLYVKAAVWQITPVYTLNERTKSELNCSGILTKTPRESVGKICLLTMGVSSAASWDNKQHYCELHNYDCSEVVAGKERPAAWYKLLGLLDLLETCDYAMWVDDDAILANDRAWVENIIDFAGRDKDLIFAEDQNWINSGVFIVRKSEWSRWFLKTAWDQEWLVAPSRLSGLPFKYEQRAIHYLTGVPMLGKVFPEYKTVLEHLAVIPPCLLNSNVCEDFWLGSLLLYKSKSCPNRYHAGDFIIHFAGKSPPEFYRMFLIRLFFNLPLPDWRID